MDRFWLKLPLVILILMLSQRGLAREELKPSSDPTILGIRADNQGIWRDVVFTVKATKSKRNMNRLAVHRFLQEEQTLLGTSPDNLVLTRELESGGNYVAFFQQYRQGKRVFDSDLQLVTRDGQIVTLRNRTRSMERLSPEPEWNASDIMSSILARGGAPLSAPECGIFESRWAYRVQVNYPSDVCELTIDATTGEVLHRRGLLQFERTGNGLVFYPNPVSSSGNISLQDEEDAAYPMLESQMMQVSLPLIDESDYLRNEYVDLTASGIQMGLGGSPSVYGYQPGSAKWSDSGGIFHYDRDDFRFEEVNTYYWITRASQYIDKELGFPEAVDYRIPVHVHYMYADSSFYTEIDHGLHFGDGGVDDAEDAEIVLHEMGHAIIHNLVPGFGDGWEAGSLDEGISDYIAAATSEDTMYPDTIGEWDATEYDSTGENPPRLRPIVTDRLYPENMGDVNSNSKCTIWPLKEDLMRGLIVEAFPGSMIDQLNGNSKFFVRDRTEIGSPRVKLSQ